MNGSRQDLYEAPVPGYTPTLLQRLFLPLALAAAGLLAAIDGSGSWMLGWLPYSFLLVTSGLLLVGVQFLTRSRAAARASWTAFLLRLFVGVVLFLLFPSAGYQGETNLASRAGYVFDDAYVRDQEAWSLATSNDPLSIAFANKYPGDQYGGMMWLSAAIYRTFSRDAHRPFLILILTATVSALGVLFTWKGAEKWLGEKGAHMAAWIFALYPMGVLLGASHMREGFVMTGVAMTFYSLTRMWERKPYWLAWLAGATALLLLFQPAAALFGFFILGGAWFFDPHRHLSWKHAAVIAAIILLAMVVVISIWASLPSIDTAVTPNVFVDWLQKNFAFQSHLTERGSGMIQKLLRDAGERWKVPIFMAYGIAQPVFPAALADKPGVPLIWRTINIFTSGGWYLLLLFLVYGSVTSLRRSGDGRQAQWIWLSAITWVWILVAVFNAGSDQWDNPRYRAMFLPWQALLAAWAWGWAGAKKDVWLKRLFLSELVFVLTFTLWYIGRNYIASIHMSIWTVIPLALVSSTLVLLVSLVLDWRAKKHGSLGDRTGL